MTHACLKISRDFSECNHLRCGGLGVETIQGDGPALIPSGTVPDGFEWLQERLDHLELRVAVLEAVKEVAEPGGEPCNSQDSGDIVRRRARRRNCSSMSALDDVQSVCKVTSLMSRQTASQLTQGQLDVSDMCTIKESVWDAGLFVGLTCIGNIASALMVPIFCLNIVLQMGLTWIVYYTMVQDPLDSEMLDQLVRFRLDVAHSALYANPVTYTSMISQLCVGDSSLHIAAVQMSLFDGLKEFSSNSAVVLCVFAQLAWFILILEELNAATTFFRAVLDIPREEQTRLIIADGFDDEFLDPTLVKVNVVTRMQCISRKRLVAVSLLVTLPRWMVAVALGFAGSLYLSQQVSQAEVVLKMVALEFILSLDELIYHTFVPRRLHIALFNMEPLHRVTCKRWELLWTLCKFAVLSIAVVLAYVLLLRPFFGKVHQALNILCSGDTNFIYSVNPASGVVYAAHGNETAQMWSSTEQAVFQLTNMVISASTEWAPHSTLVAASMNGVQKALVQPGGFVTLAGTEFNPSIFEWVQDISSYSVADGSKEHLCRDFEAGASHEAVLEELRAILGNDSVTSCISHFHLVAPLCGQHDQIKLRTYCPIACGCRDVFYDMLADFSGWPSTAYGSAAFGCPAGCARYREAVSEFNAMSGEACVDTPAESLIFHGIDGITELDSVPLVDESGDIIAWPYSTVTVPRWLAGYLRSIQQRNEAHSSYNASMYLATQESVNVGWISQEHQVPLWQHIISGGMVETVLGGTWEFMPGVPHPRNLTGCAFLASYEFGGMMNTILCVPEEQRSIRNMCPVSCHCTRLASECPYACE